MIRGKIMTSMGDVSEVMDVRGRASTDKQGDAPDAISDEYDRMAIYALAYDECGAPGATGRLIIKEDRFYIGRVYALKELRGRGYGDLIMRMLLHKALLLNADSVYVSSPPHATRFFARYGFKPAGGICIKEGVPRQEMRVNSDEIILTGTCPASSACARSRREASR